MLGRAPGSRGARCAFCAVMLGVFLAGAAQATTLSWVGGDGLWNDPANWDPAVVPQAGDRANLVQADATTRTVSVHTATPGALAQLTVDATGSGDMTLRHDVSSPGAGLAADIVLVGDQGRGTLVQAAGQVTAKILVALGQRATGKGVYDLVDGVLSTAQLNVGKAGGGAFQHSGGIASIQGLNIGDNGSYRLSGGVLDMPDGVELIGFSTSADPARRLFEQTGGQNNAGTVHIGKSIYDLSGGTLAADLLWVGETGSAQMVQSGGSNRVSGTLFVRSTAQYALSSGSLRAQDEKLGYHSTTLGYDAPPPGGSPPPRTFVQSGGSNNVIHQLVVGSAAGTTATYELSGTGVLNIEGQPFGPYFLGSEVIGDSGTGIFSQTGGTHTVDSRLELILGLQTIGKGTYAMSGGSLGAGTEILGNAGRGVFEQSAGTHTVTGTLYLGGDYNGLSGVSTGDGRYALSGGDLSARIEMIGSTGHGELTQTGGTNQVQGHLVLGKFGTGVGTYHLGGGGSLSTQLVDVGLAGTGDFVQDGGAHTNLYMHVGSFGAAGHYTLSGGTLHSLSTMVGAAGRFDFIGGRLAVDRFYGELVNQGGTLAPGNSPGTTHVAGDYRQQAGATLEVEIGGLGASSGYDQLLVDGTASLDGVLDVLLLSGFDVAVGDTFDIVVAQTVSGAFSSLVLPDLGLRNMHFGIDYLLDPTGNDIVRLAVLSGSGYDANVTPEPETLLLAMSGLWCALIVRRRARRGKAAL